MTPYGAFLDSSVDRYAEIVLYLGVLWRFAGEPLTQLAAMLALTGSLMVSYTKARAEGLGEEVTGGFLQRPERIVILAVGSFLGATLLPIVLWILAVLTSLTSVQRMWIVAAQMRTTVHSTCASKDRPEGGAGMNPARPRI
jgi:CDP-diacylglycerol--glycerol-3-phosphate 3-phosphatidyltransferase